MDSAKVRTTTVKSHTVHIYGMYTTVKSHTGRTYMYVYDNQIRHCITDLSYINGWVEAVTYIHEIRAQKSCLVALYFLRSFYSFTVRLYICTCIQQSNHTLYIYVYMYMTIKSHTVHVCIYVYDNQITHCTCMYIRI